VGETPDQFVDRLKRYLDKWREMAGYKDNYDDLKDMIIHDQYFLTCDKSLQTFLKEKGKLNLEHMCKASNDNREHKDKHHGMSKPFNHHKSHNGPNNSGLSTQTMHCDNCGMNNHNTSECRKPRTSQGGTYNSDIVCFLCNKAGHRRNQCPMNRATHKTAAMHQLNNDYSYTKPHQCDNAQCKGQIKLACGCMLPVVAGAMSPNGQNKLKNW